MQDDPTLNKFCEHNKWVYFSNTFIYIHSNTNNYQMLDIWYCLQGVKVMIHIYESTS